MIILKKKYYQNLPINVNLSYFHRHLYTTMNEAFQLALQARQAFLLTVVNNISIPLT